MRQFIIEILLNTFKYIGMNDDLIRRFIEMFFVFYFFKY